MCFGVEKLFIFRKYYIIYYLNEGLTTFNQTYYISVPKCSLSGISKDYNGQYCSEAEFVPRFIPYSVNTDLGATRLCRW